MDETQSGLFRGGRIIGIHAEQDDLQVRECISKQMAGFGAGNRGGANRAGADQEAYPPSRKIKNIGSINGK